MSGPPRKPLQFRRAEGNLAKSKIRPESEDPKLAPGTPKCPDHLAATARWCWEHLVPMLAGAKLLTLADLTAIEAGCLAYQDMRETAAVIRDQGRTYETETDNGVMIRPRPEVQMHSDAWKRYKSFLSEYGLTAAARAKVSPLHNSDDGEASDFS